MFWTLTQVALGGAIGSVGRYLTGLAATRAFGASLPMGTLIVNIAGSFVTGLLFIALERGDGRHVPLLMTGILGGFTTFSAFSLDSFRLWERGDVVLAAFYVAGSVVVSILALAAGVMAMRAVMT